MNRSSTWWEARQAKSATRSWQRIDYDAMGYAAAAEDDVAASYEHPQYIVAALASRL